MRRDRLGAISPKVLLRGGCSSTADHKSPAHPTVRPTRGRCATGNPRKRTMSVSLVTPSLGGGTIEGAAADVVVAVGVVTNLRFVLSLIQKHRCRGQEAVLRARTTSAGAVPGPVRS